MTELVVLKTDPDVIEVGDTERAVLGEVGARLVERPCPTEEELIAHGRDAAAILTLDEPLTSRVIASLRRCRVISRFGIGVDKVDLDAATSAGIVVTNVPDYCVDEASDHALALMLAVERRIPALDAAVRAGTWDTAAVAGRVRRLRGRRAGVIGFGRLGARFACKAAALGLEICVHDPFVEHPAIESSGARPLPLDELLATSDVVSLHIPLTPDTRHLLDRRRIFSMPEGAVLINTSRGGLVDEVALVDALRQGRLGGAGLDVFEQEPPGRGHPLLTLPNVVVTSHSSHYSLESGAEMRNRAFRNVAEVLAGRPPLSPVNAVPSRRLPAW
jgi:D-3-phosphoglycerate dehydrogenase / 2-oxoglutarate reductase